MRLERALLLASLALLTATAASAQRPGFEADDPVVGSRPLNPNYTSSPGSNSPDTSMPVFISGKVTTGDGSELPQSVSIIRICGANRRTVGYPDGKGRFNIRFGGVGSGAGSIADASDSGNPERRGGAGGNGGFGGGPSATAMGGLAGQNPLLGCELEVSAPGFRPASIDVSTRRVLDNTNVGTIVIQRIAGVEGTSVSATSFSAPKEAQKALQKGEQLMQKSQPDLAAKEFEKATGIYPKYAAAWLDLGRARVGLKDDAAAGEAFRKGIDADPKLVDCWGELGLVELRRSNWPEAAENLDHALRLNPVEFPHLWFYDAVANFNMKNLDVAEKSAREALRVDSAHQNPKAYHLLGLILFQKKDLPGALDALRTYLNFAHDPAEVAEVQAQISELENGIAARQ